MAAQNLIDNHAKERCTEIASRTIAEKKAKNMADSGVKELCAAIITQAIDDYDQLLYTYYMHPRDPVTNELVKLEDFNYLYYIKRGGRSLQEHFEISVVEKFFDSEWFTAIAGSVGGYHSDQIRKVRRILVGKKALRNGVIRAETFYELFVLNGWEFDESVI